MVKKTSQLSEDTKKIFSETEVGTLLEDIDDKLGTIIEGQEMMKRQLKVLAGDTENVKHRLDTVEVRVDAIDSRR